MPRRPSPDVPATRRTATASRDQSGTLRAGSRPLTQRQLDILGQVARGHTNREIGVSLGISERTVTNHMRTILRKLATGDRTHAVVLAIGHGWMPIPIEPEEAEVTPEAPASIRGRAVRSRR